MKIFEFMKREGNSVRLKRELASSTGAPPSLIHSLKASSRQADRAVDLEQRVL